MCFCQAKGLLHIRGYPSCSPCALNLHQLPWLGTLAGERGIPHLPMFLGVTPAPLRRSMGCVCRFRLHPQGLALASSSGFSLMGATAMVTSVA